MIGPRSSSFDSFSKRTRVVREGTEGSKAGKSRNGERGASIVKDVNIHPDRLSISRKPDVQSVRIGMDEREIDKQRNDGGVNERKMKAKIVGWITSCLARSPMVRFSSLSTLVGFLSSIRMLSSIPPSSNDQRLMH